MRYQVLFKENIPAKGSNPYGYRTLEEALKFINDQNDPELYRIKKIMETE